MTERLYYTDCYLAEFEAEIVGVVEHEGRPAAVLDRTAFYPTSGGQPYDTGTLAGLPVIDVIDRDDGTILHVVDGVPPAGRVCGRVRWDRRFEHMQQHTGQHVLSAAFDSLHQVPTVSFHLGALAATIDLAREVSAAEVAAAEDAANAVIWEDRPVVIRFVSDAEAGALPLRKEPARTGRLRIVEIQNFDVSACGGTHVASTGAIGSIMVSAWERFKGGTRIEFRCGVRALRAHRALRDTLDAAARSISAGAAEVPAAVERLLGESRDLRRRVKELESRLAGYEVDAVAARAVPHDGVFLALEIVRDVDAAGIKAIAQGIGSKPGHAAVLITGSTPVSVAVGRAGDVSLDAAALVKELAAAFGGRGGGRPELAQGGGLAVSPEDAMAWLRRRLAEAPPLRRA